MKKNKITQIVLTIILMITLSACNDDITDVKNLVTYNMYAVLIQKIEITPLELTLMHTLMEDLTNHTAIVLTLQ